MGKTGSSIKEELAKIRHIPTIKKKLEYIWEYYYIPILVVVAVILFGSFAFKQYTTALTEHWCYIIFNNTYADVGDGSKLWDGYVEYSGYDTKEKKIEFNNTSYFDYENSVTGNSYFEAFVAYADAGTLDAITMEKNALVSLGESGRLMDLDREECKAIKEKYGDRFLYCKPYDEEYGKDQVAVGIDVSDSVLVTKYHVYPETCAIGIGANSQNIEAVEKFLDYIFEEAE